MTTSTARSTKKTTASKKAPAVLDLGADLSPAVAALERAYRMFQRRFPDAPDVTIVVKRDQVAWGHITVAKVWAPQASKDEDASRFEIMVSGENLRRGAEQVAATLLHEAAHARNLSKGILDTDVNGRHNIKFKTTAEEHGLVIEQDGWRGWTKTSWSPEGLKTWASLIKVIDTGLQKAAAVAPASLDHLPKVPGGATAAPVPGKGSAGGLVVAPPKRGNRNLVKATCGCGLSIRASKGVLAKCEPTCSTCGEPFTA